MNIREIAQLAGVSISTVSKVLNRKDQAISEETRRKVLAVMKENHYQPYVVSRFYMELRTSFPDWAVLASARESSAF